MFSGTSSEYHTRFLENGLGARGRGYCNGNPGTRGRKGEPVVNKYNLFLMIKGLFDFLFGINTNVFIIILLLLGQVPQILARRSTFGFFGKVSNKVSPLLSGEV